MVSSVGLRVASTSRARATSWTCQGSSVPPSQDEQIRINLWLFGGQAPLDGQPVQVRFSGFAFSPL
jgi:hypothetical protein